MAEVIRIVTLGRKARDASSLKLRQPLRRLVVEGAVLAHRHTDEIAEELSVKKVEFGPAEAVEVRVKPNLPVLGPKLGAELGPVRADLQAGRFEQLPGGGVRVAGHELGPDEVLVERAGREGWAVAADDGLIVALDTSLDAELELEGRARDLIHTLNSMRKDAGLALTDRITVTLPETDADLLVYEQWIKDEVLATEIRVDGGGPPRIAKA
jgi:isoleucyl-tRNA synthetase